MPAILEVKSSRALGNRTYRERRTGAKHCEVCGHFDTSACTGKAASARLRFVGVGLAGNRPTRLAHAPKLAMRHANRPAVKIETCVAWALAFKCRRADN